MHDGLLQVGLERLPGPEGLQVPGEGPDDLQPGASWTSLSSGPAAASAPWRMTWEPGTWRPPAAKGPPPFFCSSLRISQRFPTACQIAIKFSHFKVNCCPLTFRSVMSSTPRSSPLPHPDNWHLCPTGFSGPCSLSPHQFLAPLSEGGLQVLTWQALV